MDEARATAASDSCAVASLSVRGCGAADIRESAQAILEHLGRRYSVGPKYLALPAPSEAELLQASCVALRAPNHGGLPAFRFVHVSVHQRELLGALFARDAARRGYAFDDIERARQRAHNGPALIALVGHLRTEVDVPVHEQWLCIGAGLMNFLNALHLMGFGAKTLSGESLRDADVQAAFCDQGEQLLAWIVAGTPTRAAHAKRADDASRVLTHWCP